MPDLALYFDDVSTGQVWTSTGRTVTEADIVSFACATGDFNPLHVDAVFAAQSIYRRPIAHGLLGISWAAGLGSNYPRMHTLAFVAIRDWEFLKPVHVGDTVCVRTTVLDKVQNGRRSGKVAWVLLLLNQKGEEVQRGVFETIVAVRPRSESHAAAELTQVAEPAPAAREGAV
jgi:3-hydroxybutyryl-CoA dehydratase